MKKFYVDLSFGKKAPAFGVNVVAANEQDAIIQAKTLARLSGWSELPKKAKAVAV